MSLSLLHDLVRAEVQNDEKTVRSSLRKLTSSERQAVRAMRRQKRAASSNRRPNTAELIWF